MNILRYNSKMQASNNETGVGILHNTIRFAKFYAQSQKADNLYLVVGPRRAGKSLVIDLLTQKTITQIQNQRQPNKTLLSNSNPQSEYDPIYFQTFSQKGRKSIFLQGFTLSAQSDRQTMNSIKSLFAKEGIKNCQNLSIILVIEQSQIETLAQITEHLLTCLNLYDEKYNEIVKELLGGIYLLFTKPQAQGSAIESFSNIHDELIEESRHQGTKDIVQEFNKEGRYKEFFLSQQSSKLGIEIKDAFKPKPLSQKTRNFFAQKEERQEVVISEQQEVETITTVTSTIQYFQKLIQMIISPTAKQQYEKFLCDFFKTDDQNLKADQMKNPLWRGKPILEKTPNILQLGQNKKSFKKIVHTLETISQSLLQTAELRQGYLQILGMVEFFIYLLPWIRDDTCSLHSLKVVEALKKCLEIISTQKEPENSVMKKPSLQKKGLNKKQTLFSILKSSLQRFTRNQQVLEYCLGLIREKEKSEAYQWSDVIYPLRLTRDLLRQFDFGHQLPQYLFVEEILHLYLYNESYYQFQRLLNLYIRQRVISIELAKKLLFELNELKRFDSAGKLVNYLIAQSSDDEELLILSELKKRTIQRSHQVFMDRSQNKESSVFKRKSQILVSFEEIRNKSNSKIFQNFMKSNSFQRFLDNRT